MEFEGVNRRFIETFPWKHAKTVEFIRFMHNKTMYAQLALMALHLVVPYSLFSVSTPLFVLYTLLAPVVYLMYFVHKYKDG